MPAPGHQMVLGPDGRPRCPVALAAPASPAARPASTRAVLPGPPAPQRPPAHAEPEAEHGGGGEHECAGHGPDDAPPPINLWHGLLMVNNERALQGGFVNQLLFRYENPNDPCDPKNEPAPYMASLINFAVLAFVLFHFGRKPLADVPGQAPGRHHGGDRHRPEAQGDVRRPPRRVRGQAREHRGQAAARCSPSSPPRPRRRRRTSSPRPRSAAPACGATPSSASSRSSRPCATSCSREAVIGASVAAEALIQRQMSAADQDRMAADFLRAVGPALRVGVSAGGRS